jgi:hypothetical protein
MLKVCLENLENSRLQRKNKESASQYKLCLLSTAQMWGSGKTYLGTHFLDRIRDNQELIEEVKRELGSKYNPDDMKLLLDKEKFHHIDLRRFRHEVLKDYLSRSLLSLHPEDGDYWAKQEMSSSSCGRIISWFMQKYK